MPVACAGSNPSAQPATAVLKSALLLTEHSVSVLGNKITCKSEQRRNITKVLPLQVQHNWSTLPACEQVCKCCDAARRRPPSLAITIARAVLEDWEQRQCADRMQFPSSRCVLIWTSLRGVTA